MIDEADRLFDMGFLPDIKKTAARRWLPRSARQSMLFSATLSRVSRKIAAEYLNHPAFIELTPEQLTVDTITQELYHVKSHIKANLLLGILQEREAAQRPDLRQHAAHRLPAGQEARAQRLSRALPVGRPAPESEAPDHRRLHGRASSPSSWPPTSRPGASISMTWRWSSTTTCLRTIENYVHRIGRTARAGNSGKAISFACERFGKHLEDIESFIAMKIPVETAAAGLFATDNGLEHELKMRAHRRPQNSVSPQRNSGHNRRPGMRWERKPLTAPA